MKTKICKDCKKELPLNRDYFTVAKSNKDGFHNKCKICRGFKNYGISLPRENAMLKKEGLKRCSICKEIKPIDIYEQVGKTRLKEWCPDCDEIAKRNKSEYDRIYFENNKERKREYYSQWKDNGGRYIRNINEQKRRCSINKSDNYLTIDEWNLILDNFNHECAYCGKKQDILSQDHVIPVIKGGGYTIDNIIPACNSCNSRKNSKDLSYFYDCYDYFTEDRYLKILEWINNIKTYFLKEIIDVTEEYKIKL